MNSRYILGLALAITGFGFAPVAAAQDRIQLDSEVEVERTKSEGGQTKVDYLPPVGVVPGDRLRFTTGYDNRGSTAAENFVVTNPLPEAVALAKNEDAFVVSVDQGQTFGTLAELQIKETTGEYRAAELTDVTHIRWTLERVAPGETGTLTYFGIVR
ncbi:hypothetical protein E3U23_10925 [Erythrobacter litoralis]|uniref:hypothetical protein n=1 Tax=Erythrobacter litoralis TaxID=39960 RepID=UPI0024357EE7|nr:hypothetical protein [Erythrobacter litoralis]MDG6079701.1 hypothetical protein [Erythrobacter litoralis]